MNIKLITYFLFLAGFSYYCILPIIILTVVPDFHIARIAMNSFHETEYGIELFSYLAFLYFISFSIGYYFSFKIGVTKPKFESKSGVSRRIVLVTSCYVFMAILIVNVNEIISPIGYTEGYDVIHRGQLTTLYLTSIWWFVYLRTGIQARLMLVIVFISGLNLLFLGSRLGFISGLVALFIFDRYFRTTKLRDLNTKKMGWMKFIVIIFIIFVSMTMIGLVRAKDSISWEGIMSIFIAESLYIYASVPAYFLSTSLPLVAIPTDIFSGFIGGIPSFLFPEKINFFEKFSAMNEYSGSGFGGANHVVVLIANFGLIGFPIAAFLEGAWFGTLVKYINVSAFFRAVALLSIAVIPFILFRDGYQTSIKLLFINFLLIPYLVTKILFLSRVLRSRRARYSDNPPKLSQHVGDQQ